MYIWIGKVLIDIFNYQTLLTEKQTMSDVVVVNNVHR